MNNKEAIHYIYFFNLQIKAVIALLYGVRYMILRTYVEAMSVNVLTQK